jgi:hypothetical protein
MRRKLSGEETGGAVTVMQFTIPEGMGPPPHVHDGDETVTVLDGRAASTSAPTPWNSAQGPWCTSPPELRRPSNRSARCASSSPTPREASTNSSPRRVNQPKPARSRPRPPRRQTSSTWPPSPADTACTCCRHLAPEQRHHRHHRRGPHGTGRRTQQAARPPSKPAVPDEENHSGTVQGPRPARSAAPTVTSRDSWWCHSRAQCRRYARRLGSAEHHRIARRMEILQSACRGRSPRHGPVRSSGHAPPAGCDGCAVMPMVSGLFLPIFGELACPGSSPGCLRGGGGWLHDRPRGRNRLGSARPFSLRSDACRVMSL